MITKGLFGGLGLVTGAIGWWFKEVNRDITNLKYQNEKLKQLKIECIKMEKDNKQTIQDKIQLLQDYNRLR